MSSGSLPPYPSKYSSGKYRLYKLQAMFQITEVNLIVRSDLNSIFIYFNLLNLDTDTFHRIVSCLILACLHIWNHVQEKTEFVTEM